MSNIWSTSNTYINYLVLDKTIKLTIKRFNFKVFPKGVDKDVENGGFRKFIPAGILDKNEINMVIRIK